MSNRRKLRPARGHRLPTVKPKVRTRPTMSPELLDALRRDEEYYRGIEMAQSWTVDDSDVRPAGRARGASQ